MARRGLCEAGHDSLVIACEGSQVLAVVGYAAAAGGSLDSETQQCIRRNCRAPLCAMEHWNPILFTCMAWTFLDYLPPNGVPVVATLHLPPSWSMPRFFAAAATNLAAFVSASQQDACPKERVCCHSFEWSSENLRETCEEADFALRAWRICPENGLCIALKT